MNGFRATCWVLALAGAILVGVDLAEGIHDLVAGVFGTGAILICLVPLMVWLMHIRPRRHGGMKRRG